MAVAHGVMTTPERGSEYRKGRLLQMSPWVGGPAGSMRK
jgi:hypothetical protein